MPTRQFTLQRVLLVVTLLSVFFGYLRMVFRLPPNVAELVWLGAGLIGVVAFIGFWLFFEFGWPE